MDADEVSRGRVMGDRYDRSRLIRGVKPPTLAWPMPETIKTWGLPAQIGHNNGPPLEEEVADAFVRYRWKKAHAEVWKNPSLSILKFRVARAEAAGVTYREYMLELLDSGRHLQADDMKRKSTPRPRPKPTEV